MGRPAGAKNKRTLIREARMRERAENASIAISRVSDDAVRLDCLAIMERAMWHFQRKALEYEELGVEGEVVDGYVKDAALMAEKVAPYQFPKLSALKVSGDKDNPLNGKDKDQLRAEILAEMRELGLFEDMEQLSPPQGVANKTTEEG